MYLHDAYAVWTVAREERQPEPTSAEVADARKHQAFAEEAVLRATEGGDSFLPGVDRAETCVIESGQHVRQGRHCPHVSTREERETVTRVEL